MIAGAAKVGKRALCAALSGSLQVPLLRMRHSSTRGCVASETGSPLAFEDHWERACARRGLSFAARQSMRFTSVVGAGMMLALVGCEETPTIDESSEAVAQASDAIAMTTLKLKNKNQVKFWSGSVDGGEAPQPDAPPECAAVACDHVRLKLDLPNGTFNNPNRPGGVQVALRWQGEFNTLHLWVYKNDELVAASPGIIAVSQSALIPSPENGDYDIWVAYEPGYNVGPSVEYEGLAEVEFQQKINPVRTLLPDLEFRSTERITFESPSFPIFEPDPPPGSTCFTSEMEEDGAQVCLRFDQIVANVGKGALEIEHVVPPGDIPEDYESYPVSQRVYNSDGTFADQEAGTVELHGVHGHFHYSSFANSALWLSNAEGAQLGSEPVRAQQKVSFCMADIRLDQWGKKGDGPRTYGAPDCLFPAFADEAGDHYRQGITTGWEDIYDWYIPDQYIEVSGLADGYYLMTFCADPQNEIEEADEGNNCISNLVHLQDVDSPSRQVTFIGEVGGDDDCDD